MNWNIATWQSADFVAALIIVIAATLMLRNIYRRIVPRQGAQQASGCKSCSSCGGCPSRQSRVG